MLDSEVVGGKGMCERQATSEPLRPGYIQHTQQHLTSHPPHTHDIELKKKIMAYVRDEEIEENPDV
jgi:hypothetical protein